MPVLIISSDNRILTLDELVEAVNKDSEDEDEEDLSSVPVTDCKFIPHYTNAKKNYQIEPGFEKFWHKGT